MVYKQVTFVTPVEDTSYNRLEKVIDGGRDNIE